MSPLLRCNIGDEMEEFDGSFSSIFSNLLGGSQSRIGIVASLLVSIIVFTYTSADLILNQTDLVEYAQTDKEWKIIFEDDIIDDDGDNLTFEYTEIWADQDIKVIDFFIDDIEVEEGYNIAYIDVKITPEECHGDPDREGYCESGVWFEDGGESECDAVTATFIGDNSTLSAQWFDENSVLTGADSDCEPIYLRIITYPNYNLDNDTTQVAVNEYQALSPWKINGWGEGTVSVQVHVDVQSYGGFTTGILDDSEEIDIEVSVHQFRPSAILESSSTV